MDQLIQQTKEGRQRHQQLKEKRKQRAKERLQKIKQREAMLQKQEGILPAPLPEVQETPEETLHQEEPKEAEEPNTRSMDKAMPAELSVDLFLASIRSQQGAQQP